MSFDRCPSYKAERFPETLRLHVQQKPSEARLMALFQMWTVNSHQFSET